MNRHHAFMMSAARAAEEGAACFHAVADDLASAVFAEWRYRMNGTFETIEIARHSVYHHFKRLVVIVSTNFTSHNFSP
jgi:hypothetical protein